MSGEQKTKIRQSHFPISLYINLFLIFLLMSGIHTGMLILLESLNVSDFVQINVPILYWAVVSAVTTLYITHKIKQVYEAPMKEMAEATARVAKGDFSVYVAPLHTTKKYDYLDVMIMDFNKMVEELRSIETLKTDFFSNVSHEFKTPLSIIQNAAVLIQSPNITEEERKEFAATISHACGRLNNLITNMLKLSKLEKQAIAPQKVPYDVCRQLAECAIGFEDLWEKKNIDFEAELEDEAVVYADPELMELVWNNLLSNALKFTEPLGTIQLIQSADEHWVTVSVQDTGCGMSESVKSHIFDKFFQGDTSHATEGNGLGLALVKRILELSDAELNVTSEEGKGSCFTVKLKRSTDGTI